jgi:hypothetical protein
VQAGEPRRSWSVTVSAVQVGPGDQVVDLLLPFAATAGAALGPQDALIYFSPLKISRKFKNLVKYYIYLIQYALIVFQR